MLPPKFVSTFYSLALMGAVIVASLFVAEQVKADCPNGQCSIAPVARTKQVVKTVVRGCRKCRRCR